MRISLTCSCALLLVVALFMMMLCATPAAADLAHDNLVEGNTFLAQNAEKEGVTSLPSGLQYSVIQEGDGPKPILRSKVTVHYEGRVIDGTVFDSSYKRGTPATFGVTQVIRGWTEALQLMSKGSIWELYIPSDLAYGSSRRSAVIGPNQMLIFKVELLDIQGGHSEL